MAQPVLLGYNDCLWVREGLMKLVMVGEFKLGEKLVKCIHMVGRTSSRLRAVASFASGQRPIAICPNLPSCGLRSVRIGPEPELILCQQFVYFLHFPVL